MGYLLVYCKYMYLVCVQVTTVDGVVLLEEEIANYHKEITQLITQTREELKGSEGRVTLICSYETVPCVRSRSNIIPITFMI